MSLPVPCPVCGEPVSVRISILESTVRDGAETHRWNMDTAALREHTEQHLQAA
jgi:hypothetical protein